MQVMWKGLEHVRTLRRGDLGINPEDDTELVWSAETRFTQEVTPEEYEVLRKHVGGAWAVVEDAVEAVPSAKSPPVDASSSSDAGEPQEASDSPPKGGKSAKA